MTKNREGSAKDHKSILKTGDARDSREPKSGGSEKRLDKTQHRNPADKSDKSPALDKSSPNRTDKPASQRPPATNSLFGAVTALPGKPTAAATTTTTTSASTSTLGARPAGPTMMALANDPVRQKSFRERMDKLDPPTVNVPATLSTSEVGRSQVKEVSCLTQVSKQPTVQLKPVKIRELIKTHLLLPVRKQEYEVAEIYALLNEANASFLKQAMLLEFDAPVNICGDIHGQYSDLIRIFHACGMPFQKRYLFLGDYVDRGRHSLEVIMLLFACKVLYPKHIFLLRGNHELSNINRTYGFMAELQQRYRDEGLGLWKKFNETFANMPLAALVSKRILCMHGGLSPKLRTLDDIRNIKRGFTVVQKETVEQDLLWADPEPGVDRFTFNRLRAVSYMFGEAAVNEACQKLDIDLVVRAHQVVEFGYAFFANRKLVTVFSAARYMDDIANYSAVVQVHPSLEVSFMQLKPKEVAENTEKPHIRTLDCDEEADQDK